MPVLGSSSAGAVDKQGVYIPYGWGAKWRAGRDLHASQLTEISMFGDSTADGQDQWRSWLYRCRDRAIAAGYTDGGRGVAKDADLTKTLAMSPDNLADVTALTGFASFDGYAVMGTGTPMSSTLNDSITFQGRGTAIRLFYTTGYPTWGQFTYSVDGAAAVTVTPQTPLGAGLVYISGLTEGIHTVTVVNTGGAKCAAAPHFIRSTGLVWHKFATSGTSSGDFFAVSNPDLGDYKACAAMGLDLPTASLAGNYSWRTQQQATKPNNVRCRLAIFAHGINDMQGSASIADARSKLDGWTQNAGNFVKLALAAGADPLIVVPHLYEATGRHEYSEVFRHGIAGYARSAGVAYVDFMHALGPANRVGLDNAYTFVLHSNQAAYDAEGDWLWDNVLSLS